MKITHLILAATAVLPALANAAVSFTSTADGKAITIPAEMFDTPAAKEFLNTGKNSYIGKADAAKAGKKVYQLYSCGQCHGPIGNGQVGPNLRDDTWNYAKNATDKGIFETIWAGTAGGMGAKGKGLMLADDPSQGLTVDEMLKVVAFLRTNLDAPAEAAAPATEAAKVDSTSAASTATTAAATTAAAASGSTVKKATRKVVKRRKAVKK
jgi:cytochrome c-L